MLKTLKKQSKKKILRKYRLIKFFRNELWQHIIVIAFISFYAWLFNKPYQALMFLIAHYFMRPKFNKQFHQSTIFKCMVTTLTIGLFALYIILPIEISLISTIPATFIICWVGCIVQEKADLMKEVKNLKLKSEKLIIKINNKDIYSMNEQELYEHCRNCGLSEEDCKIAYFIVIERLKGKELYQAINYSERHAKRKRKEILDKIK